MDPYVFKRRFEREGLIDAVCVGLDLEAGLKVIDVSEIFEEGTLLRDAYSDTESRVTDGKISLDTPHSIVLLEIKRP